MSYTEVGQRFTRLLVVEAAVGSKDLCSCLCDCGTSKLVRAEYLRSGHTKSCGCLRTDAGAAVGLMEVHGHNSRLKGGPSPEHVSWTGMKTRCTNPKAKDFKHYGGRGIKVCQRWQYFENFFADMGPKPSPRHSIDRINPDGDYEPLNCRWATWKEQRHNRRVRKSSQ